MAVKKQSQAGLRPTAVSYSATGVTASEEKTSVLTIRVPHHLKTRIEFAAEQQGVSINQFALYAFTKQLSELEDSEYYQQFIRNKTRQDLLAGFDAAMNKVQYRLPSEEDGWDTLKVAEPLNATGENGEISLYGAVQLQAQQAQATRRKK